MSEENDECGMTERRNLFLTLNTQLSTINFPIRMRDPGLRQRLSKCRTNLLCDRLLVFVSVRCDHRPRLLPAAYRELTGNQFAPPSLHHPFGTDLNGRDLLFRVIEGARISLLVGFAGALISFVIGTAYGHDLRLYRGKNRRPDDARRGNPLLHSPAYPYHRLHQRVRSPLKQWFSTFHWDALIGYSRIIILVLCLGLIEWLTMARIVRGQVLSLKSLAIRRRRPQPWPEPFENHPAAFASEPGRHRGYLPHPHHSRRDPRRIVPEFPRASASSRRRRAGDRLLSDGAQVINPVRSNWWLLVFPAGAMCLTLLALNFLGDALRDALDPRERRCPRARIRGSGGANPRKSIR